MSIILKNNTASDIEIIDLGITVDASGQKDISYKNTDSIRRSDDILCAVGCNDITINDGLEDLSMADGIRFISGSSTKLNGPTDISGKVRTHMTTRKLGLTTKFAGCGDDVSSINNVGGGQDLYFSVNSGDSTSPLYVDFNIANNETWLYEGYCVWKTAKFCWFTLEVVPIVTPILTGQTGTYYNTYGPLLIPAAGDGVVNLDTGVDLTQPRGGLVYIPDSDLGERPPGVFWNADWNSTTGLYENITAASLGDGNYSIFITEYCLGRYFERIILTGDGRRRFDSEDTAQLGQGMRIKISTGKVDGVNAVNWEWAATMTLHRKKTC